MSTEKHLHSSTGSTNGDRSTPAIRILLADNHPVVRIGVDNLLQGEKGVEVVGEAGDGDEAVAKTLGLHPDILLLDLNMPKLSGLEALHAIMNRSSKVKIILLTSAISRQQVIEAVQLGARGVVPKDALTNHLIAAIRAVAAGDYWIGGRRVRTAAEGLRGLLPESAPEERRNYGLTPRELEVVGCIIEARSNRDIAQQFDLSEETVKRHLSNIFEKTGVTTRLELALFAIEHQLVAPQ